MIAPLIRVIAYVSNLISRSGSYRSIAPIKPEEAVRDEVLLVDVRGQAGAETTGDELDERRVREDQAVAQAAIAASRGTRARGVLVPVPVRSTVSSCASACPPFDDGRRSHDSRIRRRTCCLIPSAWPAFPVTMARLCGPDRPSRARARPAASATTHARPPSSADQAAISASETEITKKRPASAYRCIACQPTSGLWVRSCGNRLKSRSAVQRTVTPCARQVAATRAS